MRISVKWCTLIVALLFIGQAMVLVVMLHPQPDSLVHIASPTLPKVPLCNTQACPTTLPLCDNEQSLDIESMAYLYNKFRIAATEVKRQVLKRKGDQVQEVPTKVHPSCTHNLVAATYNLWNINREWTTRANKIVELIQEIKPHFIGIQEIRKYKGQNQLDILKKMLPDYKHSIYEKVQDEQNGEEEGLGILSRYPIVERSGINFENTNRKCIRGLIDTPHGKMNFFVTHFSLNDLEQCSHAFLLWEYMNSFPSNIPQILVGDMNTYFDFEWPMDLLTQGLTPFMLGPFNPCSSVLIEKAQRFTQSSPISNNSKNQSLHFHLLKDVWEVAYPSLPKDQMKPSSGRWWGAWPAPPGHTFSNYGDQDPSRTDRMYFYSPDTKDSTLKICDVDLFGGEPIPGQSQKLYPSDHKGVAGYFLWN